MSDFIQYYNRAMYMDFSQASVYLDACFILSYFDLSEKEGKSETIHALVNQWRDGGVRKVGISNHVFEEVVYNLLKDEVHTVLYLYHLKVNQSKYGVKLTKDQLDRLGDENVAKQLYGLIDTRIIDRRIRDKKTSINVRDLMKDAKSTVFPRSALHRFYQNAVTRFSNLLFAWRVYFNIEVENLISETPESDLAQSFMRFYQLDPTDSLHLGIAAVHEYDYFLTLDHDFVHNFYTAELGNLKVLQIA
ncbi:MAG: hypothetical protein WCC10_09645 [Tumebacillaceae bacterium]